MEPSDLNTHLPPRKRLLAGFRTAATACDVEPLPAPLVCGDLSARVRDVVGSANSSPEEVVEAARSAASAAAEAAASARAAAAEKAAIAAKARAAARTALEFLDSISRGGAPRNGLQGKVKSRKKHVKVKLLYKPNGRAEGKGNNIGEAPRRRRGKETDEEIARDLHRDLNSSPRISNNGPKRPRTSGGGNACNGSSTQPPVEPGESNNGCSIGKPRERTVLCSKPDVPDDGKDSPGHNGKPRAISDNGVGNGNFSAARKVKIKRRKLLLNQYNSREAQEPKETEPSIDSIAYDESKPNGVEKRVIPTDTKAPGDGLVPMKISSMWKFKKFKTSHCSSDNKVLHGMSSSPSAAGTSASVKADS